MPFGFGYAIIIPADDTASGCGAVGSALPWGGRGRGFKSRHSDQTKKDRLIARLSGFFVIYRYFQFVKNQRKNGNFIFQVKEKMPSILLEIAFFRVFFQ